MQHDSVKMSWGGVITSIQPRTRVWRYITHNCTHYHIGCNIFLDGCADGVDKQFVVATLKFRYQPLLGG